MGTQTSRRRIYSSSLDEDTATGDYAWVKERERLDGEVNLNSRSDLFFLTFRGKALIFARDSVFVARLFYDD